MLNILIHICIITGGIVWLAVAAIGGVIFYQAFIRKEPEIRIGARHFCDKCGALLPIGNHNHTCET